MFALPNIHTKITADLAPLKRSFNDAQGEARGFASRFGAQLGGVRAGVAGVVTQVGSLAAKVASIGVGAGAAGLTALATWAVKLASDAEQTQVSFEVMLGSAERARALVAQIQAFGAVTPFSSAGLSEAAKTLLNFGVAGDQVLPVLNTLSNVAAGNEQRMQQLALVYGQVAANGRLMGQDKLQLINAGFNPLNQIAARTGETMEQLNKRMEEGRVGLGEVQQAFLDATGPGGQFYEMNIKQSQTLGGMFSTLKDNVEQSLTRVGKVIIENLDLKGIVDGLGSAVAALSQTAIPVLETLLGSLGATGGVGQAVSDLIFAGMEKVGKGLAYAYDVGQLLYGGFKLLQAGATLWVAGMTGGIDLIGDALVKLLKLTGVEVEWPDFTGQLAEGLLADAERLGKEGADAIKSGLEFESAKGVGRFFDDVRRNASAAREAAANAAPGPEIGSLKIDAPAAPPVDPKAIEAAKKLQADVDRFKESIKTPSEKFDETVAELRGWLDQGLITLEQFDRGVTDAMGDRDRALGVDKKDKADATPRETQLAGLIKAGSAEALKLQFDFQRNRASTDEIPRKQLSAAERQLNELQEIKESLRPRRAI